MPALSTAESMLSNFINIGGDDTSADSGGGDDTYFYTPQENSSTSNKYDYYDHYLCGSCAGYGGVDEWRNNNSQCVSLLLHWIRFVLGGTVKAYLSSPICLALLPLVVGVGVGFWMGRRGTNNEKRYSSTLTRVNTAVVNKSVTKDETSTDNNTLGRISQLYEWLILHIMLMLLSLDPRRIGRKSNNLALFDDKRDEQTRTELKTMESNRESGIDQQYLPRHIAVIMDGNRRHGKIKYGNATRGHWDGCETLVEFTKWCIDEGIQILTVYAFSTENWDRNPTEVSALMAIFCKYCDELRVEALKLGIRVCVLTTDDEKIPDNVKGGVDRVVLETRHCDKFTLNICLSYGGRSEITNACKSIARDVQSGLIADINQVDESEVQKRMLTRHCCFDPDIIIRTSGEERLSNFLLWQAAYSEFFFLEKLWPELQKNDLLEVIRTFAHGRQRRYGK